MTKAQRRRRKRNRWTALLILLLTVLILLIGIAVNRSKKQKENNPDLEGRSGVTETEPLGSFSEFDAAAHRADASDFAQPNVSGSGTTAAETPTTAEAGGTTTAEAGTSSTAGTGTSTTIGTAAQSSASATQTTAAGSTVHSYEQGEAYAYAYAGFTPKLADLSIAEWSLLLVNRDYMLPQDYAPSLSKATTDSSVQLDSRVAPHFQEMYNAAKRDGITLTPLSGHRRISTQKTNFENKIKYYQNQGYDKTTATQKAAQIILPPGTSEHNAGMSMDIISLDVDFEDTAAFKWLREHAEDYGFVLRYPKDKENVTKITYEPWHWRYVGQGHAKAMNKDNLCLEEYYARYFNVTL